LPFGINTKRKKNCWLGVTNGIWLKKEYNSGNHQNVSFGTFYKLHGGVHRKVNKSQQQYTLLAILEQGGTL